MRKLFLAALAALFCSTAALAHTVTLTWTVPTLRDDGSALPASAIASSQVFDAVGPVAPNPTFGTTPVCAVTGAPTTPTLSCTTATLPGGTTHTFMVLTTDTAGNKSTQSNLVTLSVPLGSPAAVSDLRAVLN